jgi:hypothetical protein
LEIAEVGIASGILLAIWASLSVFYLTAFLTGLFGSPLRLRFVAPSLLGNLAMAVCFGCFLLSKLFEGQPRSPLFGYGGFAALFIAIVIDVMRRGREGSRSRGSDSRRDEP